MLILIPSLLRVAFFTLLERKVLGIIGVRLGPYKVRAGGILQPLADAGKLLNKEINRLSNSSFIFYYLSSFLIIGIRFLIILLLGFFSPSYNIKYTLIFLFLFLGLNRLNSILRGWRTYRKFSLLGSLRTVSQLISYEILLYIVIFFFFFLYFSMDFTYFIDFPFFVWFPLLFMVWNLSVIAELNRTPYDFSEGESELVRGFNIEFGSSAFTFIFLAEYGNIFFFITLSSFLFFFPLVFPFSLFLFFLVLWIRSVLPRYRFDKLIGISWKVLFPQLSFFFLFFFLTVC